MADVTVAQVKAQIPRFPASRISDAMVQDQINRARHEANARLAAIYDPALLSPDPPALAGLIMDIAAHYVLTIIFTGEAPNQSDWVDERYDRAQHRLTAMVKSEETLVDDAGAVIPKRSSAGPWSNKKGVTPVFNDTDLGVW